MCGGDRSTAGEGSQRRRERINNEGTMNDTQGSAKDDFYVGYLPLPSSHARTLRMALPALMLAAAGVVVLVGALQRDPGSAAWREETEAVRGTLLTDPYPLVLTGDGRVVLLVEQGKHGARARVKELGGRAVVARGRALTREGRVVLELVGGADALMEGPADAGVSQHGTTASSGSVQRVTLVGEIIDSKCYHGAMKPGEGKTHKACATLCISNGIPAMFTDEAGATYLFSTGGEVPDDDTLSKIGELVEVTGEVTPLGGSYVLRVEPGSVRRMPVR